MEERPSTDADETDESAQPSDDGGAPRDPAEPPDDTKAAREAAEPPADAEAPREPGARSAVEMVSDRRIWTGLWVAAAVVLVLFMLAFWPVMRGRLDAAKQLDESQALLAQVRSGASDIDRVVQQQLSGSPAVTVPDLAPQTLVIRRDIRQIDSLIGDALPHLTEDEQRQANLVQEAADARRGMLGAAPAIVRLSARSERALRAADVGWQQTQLANSSEASANAQYAKQTAVGVATAGNLYARATTQLKSASSLYSEAASWFPEAGYKRYADQSNMRIAALALATASTKSWLAGDTTLAQSQQAQYLAANAKAAAVGKAFPSPPGRAGGDAFEKLAGSARQEYEAARAKAVVADAALSSL